MIDGRPLVDVIVNGQGPYRFLLDTGTSVNMVDPKLARAAGLTASFETTVTSTTGTTKLPGLDDVELAVGSARAGRQIVLIGGLDAVHQLSPDIQGVVGQSFLSGFDYLIDLETSRLVFGPQDADGTRVPMTIVNGRPAVETSLGRLLLDSGAHGLVLFNVPTVTGTYRLVALGGATDAGLVMRELRIADRLFWRGEAMGVRSAQSGIAGLMPIHLFRSVYVSNSAGFVQFN